MFVWSGDFTDDFIVELELFIMVVGSRDETYQ